MKNLDCHLQTLYKYTKAGVLYVSAERFLPLVVQGTDWFFALSSGKHAK